MTDDRSLERAARSWLEAGPTQAPDRAVEAALLRIQTTPQERDLRIPWRLPKMTTPARVAAAAVIGVLAVGGALLHARQTAVSPASAGQARRRLRRTSTPTPSTRRASTASSRRLERHDAMLAISGAPSTTVRPRSSNSPAARPMPWTRVERLRSADALTVLIGRRDPMARSRCRCTPRRRRPDHACARCRQLAVDVGRTIRAHQDRDVPVGSTPMRSPAVGTHPDDVRPSRRHADVVREVPDCRRPRTHRWRCDRGRHDASSVASDPTSERSVDASRVIDASRQSRRLQRSVSGASPDAADPDPTSRH